MVGGARCKEGGVAQMGEHLPCKQGVDSSSLFISTRGETAAGKQRRKPKKRAEEARGIGKRPQRWAHSSGG